ncbi:hypothetical protein QYF36_007353 [Acer negundo]|nr:hypothetical protein QYF36_007353 [Acer negundo]
MAEMIVSPIAEILLGKLVSLAYQEACLIWGFKTELLKLEKTLKTIKAVLLDAEQQQLHNHEIRVWLEELKDVCYDAEDVLDEFEIEALQRQATVNYGSITQKVWNSLSWPNSVAFRFTIGHKIKEIRERLDEIAANKAKFHLTERVDNRNAHREGGMTQSFVCDSKVIGRDHEKEEIIELLTQPSDVRHVSFVDADTIKDGLPSFESSIGHLRTILVPSDEIKPDQSFVDSCILRFPRLRALDLSGSSIEVLPKKIDNLRHLRYLDLNGNRKLKKLSKSICKLQKLETLFLSGCSELKEIPRELRIEMEEDDSRQDLNSTRIQLQSIIIKGLPNVEELPQWLLHGNTLESLTIDECPNFIALPESLQNLQSLQHLFIFDCPKLTSLPEANKTVFAAHQVCFTSLRRLRVAVFVVVAARRHSTSRPRHSTSVCLFLNWVVDEVEDELGWWPRAFQLWCRKRIYGSRQEIWKRTNLVLGFGDWRWMVVWLWDDDEDDDGDGG